MRLPAKQDNVGSSPALPSNFMNKFSYVLTVLGLIMFVSVAAANAKATWQILLLVAGVIISIIGYAIRAFER